MKPGYFGPRLALQNMNKLISDEERIVVSFQDEDEYLLNGVEKN